MTPLFPHQEHAVREAVKVTDGAAGRVAPGCIAVAHKMRLGKTRTAIETAQRLFEAGEVDTVVVVCPPAVRGVWYDPEFGQVAAYSRVPVTAYEYRPEVQGWWKDPGGAAVEGTPPEGRRLLFVVTNYEFIRRAPRLAPLVKKADRRTMLVLDEASHVSSPAAAQTRACYKLRRRCGRVMVLNGTLEGDNPGHLYAPFKIMDPAIIGCQTWTEFKARYAVEVQDSVYVRGEERKFKRVADWRNLEELGRLTAPYVLKKDTFEGMPVTLDPVTLAATLRPETWRMYKAMKDEAMVWLSSNVRASAAQAAVKVLRLAQLTSGFLGGVVEEGAGTEAQAREVGTEKLDLVLDWLRERVEEDPAFKVVLWCRFRPEALRLAAHLRTEPWWGGAVELLVGGDPDGDDRRRALRLLDPKSAPAGRAALVGTPRTGAMGNEMSAASTTVFVSNDYSRLLRDQGMARVLGPNQKFPCAYFDVVAEGPRGEKTVDHTVLRAIAHKKDLATMTAREWLRELGAL